MKITMKITKRIARSFIFPVLMKGRFDLLLRYFSNKSLLNIMYHGVVNIDSNYFSPRNIHVNQFEKQIIYLKKNFNIVSVEEAFKMIQDNLKPKKKTITISFDDGLQNNLYTALPIIEKHKVPVTFFISSICTVENSTPYLWSELISALIYFHKDEIIMIDELVFKNFIETYSKTSIFNFLKACDFEERDRILGLIEDKYKISEKIKKIPEEVWKLMNSKELIKFSSSPYVTIGSHGHLHYNLGIISREKSIIELVESKKLLEKVIEKEINMIAYPDGCYTNEIKDITESVGYKYQFAVKYRVNNDINDKRIMNRHGISSGTTYDSNVLFINKAFITAGIKM